MNIKPEFRSNLTVKEQVISSDENRFQEKKNKSHTGPPQNDIYIYIFQYKIANKS